MNTELAAMIPVDRKTAENQRSQTNPNGWEMPEKNLFARLSENTRGRILIADEKDDKALNERCNDKGFISSVKFLGQFVRDPATSGIAEPLCVELKIDG